MRNTIWGQIQFKCMHYGIMIGYNDVNISTTLNVSPYQIMF